MKKLSESVWGDIRKKSLGQEERKENEINYMNFKEFYFYLREIYVSNIRTYNVKYFDNDECGVIEIPIYESRNMDYNYMLIMHNNKQKQIVALAPNSNIWHLFSDLGYGKMNNSQYLPDKGYFKNTECIEIIDKLLGMVKKPCIKKVE